MARPPLPVGTWGNISLTESKPGQWRARTRFRDYDGHVRDVEAWGKSKAAANTALKQSLAKRIVPSSADDITGATKVKDLGERLLSDLEAEKRIRPQSIDRYRQNFTAYIVPALGEYRVRELTVGTIDRFLKALTPGTGVNVRKVLAQMLDLAVRNDALRYNLVEQASPVYHPPKPVRALSVEELLDLRRKAAAWQRGEIDDEGKPRTTTRMGPRTQAGDLFDIIDLLLATGARPAEILAVRWPDIDLEATPPTLTISGTLVYIKGGGIIRQPFTKTHGSYRVVTLPPFGAAILAGMDRRLHVRDDVIFPSDVDGYKSPNNVRRQWRKARHAAGYDWVELRTMRRTVATAIDLVNGVEDAASQLGHTSSKVTSKHYVAAKPNVAPDLTAILETLGKVGGNWGIADDSGVDGETPRP